MQLSLGERVRKFITGRVTKFIKGLKNHINPREDKGKLSQLIAPLICKEPVKFGKDN